MRVNMDSSMVGDPAFAMVADRLGLDVDAVFGKCFRVWLVCYERRSERLRRREADVAARCDGFADAMIGEDLADADGDDGVVFHGVRKRIAFLLAQAERGRKGGKTSAKSRRSTPKAKAKPNAKAPPEANATPNASGTAQPNTPAPDHAPDLAPAPDQGEGPASPPTSPAKTRTRSKAKPKANGTHPDRQAVIDAFHEVFVERTGNKPAWREKERGIANTLAPNGADEVRRRTSRMFDIAPRFPAEHPDIATLSAHWDKFLPAIRNADDLSADDLLALGDEWEGKE